MNKLEIIKTLAKSTYQDLFAVLIIKKTTHSPNIDKTRTIDCFI